MSAAVKNVAIVIDSLTGGGAEKVMLTLAVELLRQGHRVTIFSLKNVTQYTLPSNIHVVFPLLAYQGTLRGWFNTRKLAKFLAISMDKQRAISGQFDLTLFNLHESYRLGSTLNIPNCYYVIHNSFIQELKRERLMGPLKYFYMRSILKRLDGKHLIAVSKGVAAELRKSTIFSPRSVSQIYNPFNVSEIQTLASQPQHVPAGYPYILHVGRAAKAKRHDILFQALKGVSTDYKLVCLSGNVKKLDKLAKKYGIRERVVLPGFTDNPYAWMKHASVLALSSDFEGLPTVLIESLACNTPVVSTDCPHGPSEIMRGRASQFLSEVGDVDGLTASINKALEYTLTEDDKAFINEVNVSDICQKYIALC